jgi:hypothetical protein
MKFSRDLDGTLQPLESGELDHELARIEAEADAKIDALSLAERAKVAEKLRRAAAENGRVLNPDDEKAFELFCEGVLDFRHLRDQFGDRLLPMRDGETWNL